MEQLKKDFQKLEKLLDKYKVDTTHNLRLDIQAGFRQFGDGTDASSLQTIQSKYDSLLQSFEEHVGKYLHDLASNQSSDNLQKIRTICTDFSDRKNVLNYEINGKTPIDVAMNSGFISAAVLLLNKSLGVKPILKSSTIEEDVDLDRHGHVTQEDLESSKKIENDMRNQFLLEYYREYHNQYKMNPTRYEMKEFMKQYLPNELLINTAANMSNAASRVQILQETRKQDTNLPSNNPSDETTRTRVRFAQGGRKKKPRKTRKMRKARRVSR